MFLLFTFFICVSFYFPVEQKQYAVVANSFTMQFENDILTQNTYWFLPPFSNLIYFTRTVQNIEVGELNCMTRDSVMLNLHVATQFQYDSSKSLIPIVLKQFGGDKPHKKMLAANIRSTILNTCLLYDAIEYYEMRAKVDISIQQNLALSVTPMIGSIVTQFQLLDIKYPDKYNEALHEKQKIHQALLTAQNDRNTELINANTNKKESIVNANINIINANNIANMTNYNADVQSSMILADYNTRGDYYLNIKNSLGLSSQQLLAYMKADVLRNSKIYSEI